jgi:hypothetical protein
VFAQASNPDGSGNTVVDIGPLTATDGNGSATFPGLTMNKPGKGSRRPASPWSPQDGTD